MKINKQILVEQLNKFSLKKKTLFIQIFCVILPLLITDSLILTIIVNAEKKIDIQEMSNIADSVNYTITSECDSALKKVQEIYLNTDINNFIISRFDSPLDYYIKYYELGKKIGNGNMPAVIYTDAFGTVSGGNFQAVDRILNEPWYQEFDKRQGQHQIGG